MTCMLCLNIFFFICVYWLQPVFHQHGIFTEDVQIDTICQFTLSISHYLDVTFWNVSGF